MTRVLVCGGRTFATIPNGTPMDQRAAAARKATRESFMLRETLDILDRERRISVLIHGAATGADSLAASWAAHRGVVVLPFPAKWRVNGKIDKSAGPRRNRQMLTEGKPDLVVAFPGGRGTADMVRAAKEAGVEVFEA